MTLNSWSLFNFNSSYVLFTEEPCNSPFASLSLLKESQCFLRSLFVQSLITFSAAPTAMLQAGSGPLNELPDPHAAN
jgi:hypothetical protein